MKRRMTGALFALFVFAGMASAGEIKPFSQAEFDRLMQAGQSVVVPMSGALQQRFALLTAGIGKAGKTLLGAVMVIFYGTKRRPSRQEGVAGVLGVRA